MPPSPPPPFVLLRPSPPPTLTPSLGEGICIDPSVHPQHMARLVGDTESHKLGLSFGATAN